MCEMMTENCRITRWLAIGLVAMFAVATPSPAAETLYNGIVLPEAWPPREAFEPGGEPMRVPYLENPPATIPIDVGRQLFVDDFLIDATTLRRSFHRPTWHPSNPVIESDRPWEAPNEAIPFSDGVWYDPEAAQFVMWYESGRQLTCRATSRDGIHWEKPLLDVVPGTNVVMRHANRDSSTIWFDRNDPEPARRYKALVFSKAPPRGLWLYVSSDGIHWGEPVVQSKNIGDRSTFFYNPFRDLWVFSLRIGMTPPGAPRGRVYREHRDAAAGLKWRDADGLAAQTDDLYPWIGADRLDPRNPEPRFADIAAQLYTLDAVAYESLLLGMFSIWQGPENADCVKLGVVKRNEVLLGFSRDGFHWDRPDRRPFLACDPDVKAWNHGNIQSVGGGCLVVGDRLFFYASGRRPIDEEGTSRDTTGLATLRRDGFASMDAGGTEGTLTTRPMTFRGKHLFVNADVPGTLKAEMLDENDNVLTGFGQDDCIPVRGDGTLQPIDWKDGKDLSEIAGKPVRVRFYLTDGRLYSFWISPDRNGASHGYVAAGGAGLTESTDTVGLGGYTNEGRE